MPMRKYETLIFDLDDTLIDNRENIRYAFKNMLKYLNKEYNDELFEEWLLFDKQFWIDFYNRKFEIPYGNDDEHFVPYVQSLRYLQFFNNEFDMKKSLKINELFLNSLKEVVHPVENAKETLEYLSTKYKLVVASNGPKQAIKSKLQKIGCLDYINFIFTADITKNKVTKPNKLYFDELFDYINLSDRTTALMVGDSLRTDIKGGEYANIDSCWFNRKDAPLTDDYHPTFIIHNLIELKNLL